MFLDLIVVSILLALALRKNPFDFMRWKFRYLYIFPVPLVLQILAFKFRGLANPLNIISYFVILFLMATNIHLPGLGYMFIGSLLNALAFILNGGKMPVLRVLANSIGIYEVDPKHIFVDCVNLKTMLGDIMVLTFPWKRSFLVSIGDLVIGFGIIILFLSSRREER